jgi:hypothetical protein
VLVEQIGDHEACRRDLQEGGSIILRDLTEVISEGRLEISLSALSTVFHREMLFRRTSSPCIFKKSSFCIPAATEVLNGKANRVAYGVQIAYSFTEYSILFHLVWSNNLAPHAA